MEKDKNKKTCWQFAKGSCSRVNCPFLHEGRAEPHERGTKSGASNATVPVCRHYAQKGKCQYGSKCRFRHDDKAGVSSLPAVEQYSNADGSALVADHVRPPTPPPGESSTCGICDQFHPQSTQIGESDRCGARDVCESSIDSHFACGAIESVNQGMCRKWIVDSGAGLDLISREQLSRSELSSLSCCQCPKKLRTANGIVHADRIATCHVSDLHHEISALVLDKCPPVLSLGRRITQ
eukprot:3397915-Amphidinium_carterae.2